MLVLNLPCQNLLCTTGRSREMLLYKLPTNPGKHFEGWEEEYSLNLKMRYLNMLGVFAIMVLVSHIKCCIAKHVR
jgi:hypothetical protein